MTQEFPETTILCRQEPSAAEPIQQEQTRHHVSSSLAFPFFLYSRGGLGVYSSGFAFYFYSALSFIWDSSHLLSRSLSIRTPMLWGNYRVSVQSYQKLIPHRDIARNRFSPIPNSSFSFKAHMADCLSTTRSS